MIRVSAALSSASAAPRPCSLFQTQVDRRRSITVIQFQYHNTGLPQSFVSVQLAQQVHPRARETQHARAQNVQAAAPVPPLRLYTPSTPAHTSSLFVTPLSSFFPQIREKQLRHITSVLLSAAAACPIFDLRSMRAHYLQPPAPLAFTLSPRALELASLQPWCRDNTQRAQLLCCCCPLSTLAFRLPRAVNRCDSQRDFERSATARIMKRCFSIFAWRRWIERATMI